MHKHFLFISWVFIFINGFIYAQAPDTIWTRWYNGPFNYYDVGLGCALDNSGNLYVTGCTYDGLWNNYITIKYNAISGDIIWSRQYNGPIDYNDQAYACVTDNSGFLYVTGSSVNLTTGYDYLTIKYNTTTGDTIWTKRYNSSGSSGDEAQDCAVDGLGGLYVTGFSDDGSKHDYFTIKYNALTGDTIWSRRYDNPSNYSASAYACVYDSSGYLYVTGNSASDYLTIKYDAITGDTIWTRANVATNGYDIAYDCALDCLGNLYITGFSYNGSNLDWLTIKYNATTGDTIWSKRFDGSLNGNDVAYGCAVDNIGNLYVTGFSYTATGTDYLTIKYNAISGDTLWSKRYNGPANKSDDAHSCLVDNMGFLYVTGSSRTVSNAGCFTIKYNSTVNGINDSETKNGSATSTYFLMGSPNPAKKTFIIQYALPKPEKVNINIYNTTGQLVFAFYDGQQNTGVHQLRWNLDNVSSGIYFYTLSVGNQREINKMIVIK